MLSVSHLTVNAKFKEGSAKLVSDLQFEVKSGEMLAIVGESGCGKSMTAQALLGILPDNCSVSGKALLNGKDIFSLTKKQMKELQGREIVFIPQGGAESLNPGLKVKTHIYETLKKLGVKKNKKEIAIALLEKSGLKEAQRILELYPGEISGGMAQRVVLALAMAVPMIIGEETVKLVVADEPTRGVDEQGAKHYIELLRKEFREASVILITHSLETAKSCERVVVMYDGISMECGDAAKVLSELKHPYTKSLIDALPKNDFNMAHVKERRIKSEFTSGCPYYFRCEKGSEICTKELAKVKLSEERYIRCHNA